jgi:hypothetical protein
MFLQVNVMNLIRMNKYKAEIANAPPKIDTFEP